MWTNRPVRSRTLGRRLSTAILIAAFSCPIFLSAPSEAAENNWTMEFFIGIPFHFPAPLVIRQSDHPDARIRARYESKPFVRPIYYGWRIGNWRDDQGWELELIHDKLYLVNKPEDVQEFSISHGFNLLTLNRVRERGRVVERLGAGVVITHPESIVRNKRFPEDGGIGNSGYFISGPTAQVSAGKQFRVRNDLFAPMEGKFSASLARVPIADGDADVTSLSIHAVLGLGYGR